MRWVLFVILAYLAVVFQATLGGVLSWQSEALGRFGADFLAIIAVFVALRVRDLSDAMLAAWMLGLALDLTTAGGPAGTAVVGPMSVSYAAMAGLLYKVREAFFRERVLTHALLVLVFCALTHGLWVISQSLLQMSEVLWSDFWRMLLRTVAVAVTTAVASLAVTPVLTMIQPWLLSQPGPTRARR